MIKREGIVEDDGYVELTDKIKNVECNVIFKCVFLTHVNQCNSFQQFLSSSPFLDHFSTEEVLMSDLLWDFFHFKKKLFADAFYKYPTWLISDCSRNLREHM